jgi:uncharacterized membrane protein
MNFRFPTVLIWLLFFALFACQTPTNISTAPMNLNCIGNEPFWSVKIEPSGITFQLLGEEPVIYPYKGAKTQGNAYTFQSSITESRIKVLVSLEDCSDTMSGTRYPYRAEVEKDGKLLQGCAFTRGNNPAKGE